MSKLKLLRNIVAIEQDDIVKEEKTKSNIILLNSDYNLYNFDSEEVKVQNMFARGKQNKGKVFDHGKGCSFVIKGETVIYKKGTEINNNFELDGKKYVLVSEDNILVMSINGVLHCNPDYIIIKISKQARESLFTKKIKRDDGTMTELFISNPSDEGDEKHSQFFVAVGEVVNTGINIKGIEKKDIAILDYLVDNDSDIIVGYDGDDKLIALKPQTIYCKKDEYIYANRKKDNDPKSSTFGKSSHTKDVMISKKGDYEITSQVLGVIRDSKILAIEPFVFLVHEVTDKEVKSKSGISYTKSEKYLKRQVLAISQQSKDNYSISDSEQVLVDDFDIFDIELQGKKVHCINDRDILCKMELIDRIKANK